ncbi:MAG: STAS domain-containing protein [Deltaproteobacteria bacterium]|nr:STAS domain-containing protein [Deltaproteobacteria bacterium]
MDIEVSDAAHGKVILKVKGNLDSYRASIVFKEALDDLYRSGKRDVVLDLDDVEKINSFGTGKILMFYRRFKKDDGELYVKVPLHGRVKEVFEELKLDKLLKDYS